MSTDFNRLDKIRLTKLVNAIEKAASIAKASKRPEHLILAEQLRNSGFDHRFAKVATGAYNKRKTVDHMTSNPELIRGNSFAIVDADAVAAALGGVTKTASVGSCTQGLAFKYTKPQTTMNKVASTLPEKLHMNMRSAELLTVGLLQLRMAKGIDKVAQAMLSHMRLFGTAVTMHKRAAQAIFEHINNHKQASVIWDAAVTEYGLALYDVFGDVLPEDAKLLKTAGYVCPDNDVAYMIGNLVATGIILLDKADTLSKTAAFLTKCADTMDKVLTYVQNLLLLGRLTKLARSGMSLLLSAPTLGLLGASGAVRTAALTAGLIIPALSASINGDKAKAALRFITTPFLVADRDLLQTLALSDILADRLLAAQYSTADIADALTKTLLVLPQLLRPDKRLLLRATIRTRLAQNNKMSLADLTALLKSMLRLEGARGMSAELNSKLRLALESTLTLTPNLFAELAAVAGKAVSNSVTASDALKDTLKFLFELKKDKDKDLGKKQGAGSSSSSNSGSRKKPQAGIAIGNRGNNIGGGNNIPGGAAVVAAAVGNLPGGNAGAGAGNKRNAGAGNKQNAGNAQNAGGGTI